MGHLAELGDPPDPANVRLKIPDRPPLAHFAEAPPKIGVFSRPGGNDALLRHFGQIVERIGIDRLLEPGHSVLGQHVGRLDRLAHVVFLIRIRVEDEILAHLPSAPPTPPPFRERPSRRCPPPRGPIRPARPACAPCWAPRGAAREPRGQARPARRPGEPARSRCRERWRSWPRPRAPACSRIRSARPRCGEKRRRSPHGCRCPARSRSVLRAEGASPSPQRPGFSALASAFRSPIEKASCGCAWPGWIRRSGQSSSRREDIAPWAPRS